MLLRTFFKRLLHKPSLILAKRITHDELMPYFPCVTILPNAPNFPTVADARPHSSLCVFTKHGNRPKRRDLRQR